MPLTTGQSLTTEKLACKGDPGNLSGLRRESMDRVWFVPSQKEVSRILCFWTTKVLRECFFKCSKTRIVTLRERFPATEGSPRRVGDASSLTPALAGGARENAPQHDRQKGFKKQSLTMDGEPVFQVCSVFRPMQAFENGRRVDEGAGPGLPAG